MDTKKASWREEREHVRESGDNVVAFSDGVSRNDCSASAWVLCVWATRGGKRKLIPVIAAGIFFPAPISSFAAEAVALEEATKELKSWRRAEI